MTTSEAEAAYLRIPPADQMTTAISPLFQFMSQPTMITHFPPPPNIKAPPLSYATRVGDLLFVSGIPGVDRQAG